MSNFSFGQRFQLILALGIVFLLVLATNRIDKHHFYTVQNTVDSVFKDRVVAQNYIYKMNVIFNEKFLDYKLGKYSEQNSTARNNEINNLILKFKETELTREESKAFNNFQTDYSTLLNLESEYADTDSIGSNNSIALDKLYGRIKNDLIDLSDIQLQEGKKLTEVSQRTLRSNNLISNLEIGFLILIGVAMQLILFIKRK